MHPSLSSLYPMTRDKAYKMWYVFLLVKVLGPLNRQPWPW